MNLITERFLYKQPVRNNYAPQRWKLERILNKIYNLKLKIKKEEKGSKEWFIIQMKREIEQQKKHIIFLQNIIDLYEAKN